MPPQSHGPKSERTTTLPGQNVATIETSIAVAHRAIARALTYAGNLSNLGLHDDLQLIQLELERLQLDLMSSATYRHKSILNRA